MNVQSLKRKFVQAAVTFLSVLVIFVGLPGVISPLMPAAQAMGLGQAPTVLAETNPVDQVFGEGTTDQIQGKVKKDIGTTQRAASEAQGNLEEAANKVKGAAQQVEGRAQQDIGRTQGRAEDAASELQDAGNDIGDAFKNLFGQ
ncbi:MAG: CsbD family protein [Microcoleaceae cyanobacterium]